MFGTPAGLGQEMRDFTTPDTPGLDVLFVCEHALWPADRGFCVHGFQMARALHERGLNVGIATIAPTPSDAPPALEAMSIPWPTDATDHLPQLIEAWSGPYAPLRKRLADHQGSDLARFAGVIGLVNQWRPRVVIGLGQHAPMMLAALDRGQTRRIWYAADEPVYFQLSCMRRESLGHWGHRLGQMRLYTAIETAFGRFIDGVIGVNPTDTYLLRWMTGVRDAVTIRNGVDLDHFTPNDAAIRSNSIVFWGSMDFEPNVDAVKWFARYVWTRLRQMRPSATWCIVGRDPHPDVQALDGIDGIEVTGAVPNIREYARQAQTAVLPLRCGGGIKNKLLEAAAMGMPIVASRRAVKGLVPESCPKGIESGVAPLAVAGSIDDWVATIVRIWTNPALASQLGRAARKWVETDHRWSRAADELTTWLDLSPRPIRQVPEPLRRTA